MRLLRILLTLVLIATVVPTSRVALRALAHDAGATLVSALAVEPLLQGSARNGSHAVALPEAPGGAEAGASDDGERDPSSPERAGTEQASIFAAWSLDLPSFSVVAHLSDAGDAPAPIELSPAKRPPRA